MVNMKPVALLRKFLNIRIILFAHQTSTHKNPLLIPLFEKISIHKPSINYGIWK